VLLVADEVVEDVVDEDVIGDDDELNGSLS
jgi:hypothetical protein